MLEFGHEARFSMNQRQQSIILKTAMSGPQSEEHKLVQGSRHDYCYFWKNKTRKANGSLASPAPQTALTSLRRNTL